MSPRLRPLAILVCVALALGACTRPDPRGEPVNASSPSAFGRWRSMASDRITMDEWREFDALLQEIRLRVTAERQASGSEAVEAAMRARIDGETFRDVLVMGYEARLKRLEPERGEVRYALDVNIQRAAIERDAGAKRDLQRMRERQEKRLQEIDAEIGAAKKRLAELKPAAAGDTSAPKRT